MELTGYRSRDNRTVDVARYYQGRRNQVRCSNQQEFTLQNHKMALLDTRYGRPDFAETSFTALGIT
jgi:hypothetical protein